MDREIKNCIINDFLNDFMDVYGLTIRTLGHHPEQANNEVKNALVHIARATKSGKEEDIKKQIDQAKRHLERGTRDCYKLAIASLVDSIKQRIPNAEYCHGKLPSTLTNDIREIEVTRKSIYIKEAKGDSVSSEYSALYIKTLNIIEDIYKIIGRKHSTKCKIKVFFRKNKPHIKKIAIGVIVSIVAIKLISFVITLT